MGKISGHELTASQTVHNLINESGPKDVAIDVGSDQEEILSPSPMFPSHDGYSNARYTKDSKHSMNFENTLVNDQDDEKIKSNYFSEKFQTPSEQRRELKLSIEPIQNWDEIVNESKKVQFESYGYHQKRILLSFLLTIILVSVVKSFIDSL